MSDVDVEKLEGVHKSLRFNSLLFGIGWTLFMVSMIGLMYLLPFENKLPTVLMVIGWGLMGGPKIITVILFGMKGALKADYEVVTKNGFGQVLSRDGGFQSMMINLGGKLLFAVIMFGIGAFITMIHLIILSIRYLVLSAKTKAVTSIKPSGKMIILLNVAVLIGAFILGAVIQKVGTGIQTAANNAKRGVQVSAGFQFAPNATKTGMVIEEYLGAGGDVIIPAQLGGLPVVGIEAGTFWELGSKNWGPKNRNKRITSITIPDTVTFIGSTHYGVFQGCEGLTKITLPKNLKIIGNEAFKDSGLTTIVIPEGVTEIGSRAFEECANLTSVTLPQSIRRIGDSAFGSCKSLVDVNIPQKEIEYFSGYSDQEKYDTGSFKGSSKISASSQQAIRDTGYKGKF